jgi:hypothetical protein
VKDNKTVLRYRRNKRKKLVKLFTVLGAFVLHHRSKLGGPLVSKGNKLLMIHANRKSGYVPPKTATDTDHHTEMKSDSFLLWL